MPGGVVKYCPMGRYVLARLWGGGVEAGKQWSFKDSKQSQQTSRAKFCFLVHWRSIPGEEIILN